MATIPETVDQWSKYIATLQGEDLRSKWRAANTFQFVQTLSGEGMSPDDVSTILKMFVAQLLVTGQEPDKGGYVNAFDMIENDEELRNLYEGLDSAPTGVEVPF